MNQLKEMLEAYRNGERGLPTYDELAAIQETGEMLAKSLKNTTREYIKTRARIDGKKMSDDWSEYEDIVCVIDARAALAAASRTE